MKEDLNTYWPFRDNIAVIGRNEMKGGRIVIPTFLHKGVMEQLLINHMGIEKTGLYAHGLIEETGLLAYGLIY